ncbi:replication initiation protein RepM [uncultured Acinetobacter sp.]|uniref:replication initiation protein RepM n=1 Tax=uncultured Acinetobacter sp. TaxID=165433 RepID=UPI00261EE896|nr:replication initiation protein RepM [uncultured Acinetobacter sp.]
MKDLIVVKDNSLINASYNLGLVEQRLILLAIIEARKTGKGIDANNHLTVSAESYISQFGVARQTAYQALKDACDDLFERRFSYQEINKKGNIEHIRSRWVSEVRYIDNEALVRLIFSPAVVPLITLLEREFTKYDLDQISQLNSAYAVRLYELLIAWRNMGKTPIIALEDFRLRIGVSNHEYTIMGDFKKRVLEPSITQINTHTDIIAAYEQHKAGRVITGFSFTFTQKKQAKDVTPKAKKSAAKPKATKQEEQLDWMTADILDRFIGLSMAQQQTTLDTAEARLKGAKQARFKAARSGSVKQLMTEFSLDINEAMMTL